MSSHSNLFAANVFFSHLALRSQVVGSFTCIALACAVLHSSGSKLLAKINPTCTFMLQGSALGPDPLRQAKSLIQKSIEAIHASVDSKHFMVKQSKSGFGFFAGDGYLRQACCLIQHKPPPASLQHEPDDRHGPAIRAC